MWIDTTVLWTIAFLAIGFVVLTGAISHVMWLIRGKPFDAEGDADAQDHRPDS